MFSGSLFSGSGTASLFNQQQQQQTTGSLFGQKTGGLFGTPTSSTTSTGFGTGFGAGGTTGLFGQSSTGQTVSLNVNTGKIVHDLQVREMKKLMDVTFIITARISIE